MIYYIFRFLHIWAWYACLTIGFSFLAIFSTYNIFKKTEKNPNYSFIPIYNLLILLDIAELSRWNFILLLFPIVNVLILLIILYRLSVMFCTKTSFALGLILLPVVFLPVLNWSKYVKNKTLDNDESFEDEVILMTENDYKELNKVEEEMPKVDNVFKTSIMEEEPAPVFKANKIKYREMVLNDEEKEEIKRVEPVIVKDINTNKFVNPKVTEEDETIEIVEL